MKKNVFLLDPLWYLDVTMADLGDAIRFLSCIDAEYFQKGKEEGAIYLYWHFEVIIRTLRRSLECTQMNMRKSVEAIYKDKNKKKKREKQKFDFS